MLGKGRHSDGTLNGTPLHPSAVAHFTEVYRPIVNGVVASIDALRAGLSARDVHVTLVAPSLARARADEGDVVRLPSLPLPSSSGYRLCIPLLSRAARARIARASVVHVHSPFVTGRLALRVARAMRVPLVWTYHTRLDEYAHYAPFEPRLARAALIALTRRFANRCDAVIVPTAAMRERLREIGVRAPLYVVPSAIDAERFAAGRRSAHARALLGAADDATRVVLCVARLGREKNVELAIDAIAAAPDLHLAIAGDGPQRAALEAHAARRGVRERVRFTGTLAPETMPDVYAASDAFVFPSTSETQGLVLAEALAAGVAVVAVDGPVNREVLGGCGRLVPGEAAALAAALTAAATAPPVPQERSAALARFGRPAMTEAVLDVYRSVLSVPYIWHTGG